MPLAAANQYAKALLEAISRPGSGLDAETALAQIETFQAMLGESPQLRTILLSPAVGAKQKSKTIARLGTMAGLHPLMQNFLNVVIHHRRVPLLGEIRLMFRSRLDEQLGIVRADISAARELSAGQKSVLEAQLAGITGKGVRCGYEIDASLLGGLKVTLGSKVLDGSVRGKLDALGRRLASQA